MKYTWNIRFWVERILPSFLRKPIQIAWIYSLLKPLDDLNQDFLDKVLFLDRKSKFNSQQMKFAHVLNDVFDSSSRRIRVETVSKSVQATYIFLSSENETPEYVFLASEGQTPLYLRTKQELDELKGFVVYVPSSLSSEEARLKSWINYYKLADKTYKIIYE